MSSKFKRIIASLLLLAQVASLPVHAVEVNGGSGASDAMLTQEPTTLSVTLPTVLPIDMDSNGHITTANENSIINSSFGPIQIASVTVAGINGWALRDWATDFSKLKIGTQELAFKINSGSADENTGSVNSNIGVIYGRDKTNFTYDARVAAVIDSKNKAQIAEVVFVVEWHKAENNTPPVEGNDNEPEETDEILYSPEYLADFYTYTMDASTDGYRVGLTSGLTDALDNNADYMDWKFGEPLPNPGSVYKGVPVTSMKDMFSYATNVTNLNLSEYNTSNVKDMSWMFGGTFPNIACSKLVSLDLSSFNTAKVTNMKEMFRNVTAVTSLNVDGFDVSNVTDMQSMFGACRSLESLDLSKWDVSSVETTEWMFAECDNLASLTLGEFNSPAWKNMQSMFRGCKSLPTIDISSFNTANITSFYELFSGCSSSVSFKLNGINSSKVTNMQNMFRSCGALSSVDISSLDVSKVINMDSMFSGCSSLLSFDIATLNVTNEAKMTRMFQDCSMLSSIDFRNFITTSNGNYQEIVGNCPNLKTFYVNSLSDAINLGMGAYWSKDIEYVTPDGPVNLSDFYTYKLLEWDEDWGDDAEEPIIIPLSYELGLTTGFKAALNSNTAYKGWKPGTPLPNPGDNYNDAPIVSMRNMFAGCTGAISLDLSIYRLNNLFDVSYMFYNCSSLKNVIWGSNINLTNNNDYGNFNYLDATSMFDGCTSLSSIDLGFLGDEFDSTARMFKNCSSLTSLNFQMYSSSDMDEMFCGCSKLQTIDLSYIDFSSFSPNVSNMFGACSSLTVYVELQEDANYLNDNAGISSNITIIPNQPDDDYNDEEDYEGGDNFYNFVASFTTMSFHTVLKLA